MSEFSDSILTVTYTNWHGETAVRRLHPLRVYFGSTEWHPERQWLMEATDVDTGKLRDFALRDMVFAPSAPPAAVAREVMTAAARAIVWPQTKDIVLPRDTEGRKPDAIAFILGLAAEPWKIGALGPLLRSSGEIEVPKKSEAETAAALHWLIGLAVEHGDEWGSVYSREIKRMQAIADRVAEARP